MVLEGGRERETEGEGEREREGVRRVGRWGGGGRGSKTRAPSGLIFVLISDDHFVRLASRGQACKISHFVT